MDISLEKRSFIEDITREGTTSYEEISSLTRISIDDIHSIERDRIQSTYYDDVGRFCCPDMYRGRI